MHKLMKLRIKMKCSCKCRWISLDNTLLHTSRCCCCVNVYYCCCQYSHQYLKTKAQRRSDGVFPSSIKRSPLFLCFLHRRTQSLYTRSVNEMWCRECNWSLAQFWNILIHKTFKATSVTVLKILLLELIEDLSSSGTNRLKIVEIRTVKLLHKHS